VGERVRFWSVLAEEEGRTLTVDLPAVPAPVRVSAADLGAAVDALLGNVFAHTPEGTQLSVTVRASTGGGATLVVADAGPGMRDDAVARGHSGAGSTGLGLDIARRTAEGSGGLLRAASSGSGTAVTMELGAPPA
jgi:signal transduction histidine kinase